jgi:two-component system alkaline phosphatase synthesis response regulator PhoP/two-component system response regulator VicR
MKKFSISDEKIRGKQVLVAEDEASVVRLIRFLLEGEGFKVTSVANGVECLQAINETRPDLLILDIMMPVMDGFQTLSILKGNADTKDIPVIILSARKEEKDIFRGLFDGADSYLTKPFPAMSLLAAVKRILAVKSEAAKKKSKKAIHPK